MSLPVGFFCLFFLRSPHRKGDMLAVMAKTIGCFALDLQHDLPMPPVLLISSSDHLLNVCVGVYMCVCVCACQHVHAVFSHKLF